MIDIVLLGGCYGVATVLLNVALVLLGGCYGVNRCCYGVGRLLLDDCYGVAQSSQQELTSTY